MAQITPIIPLELRPGEPSLTTAPSEQQNTPFESSLIRTGTQDPYFARTVTEYFSSEEDDAMSLDGSRMDIRMDTRTDTRTDTTANAPSTSRAREAEDLPSPVSFRI